MTWIFEAENDIAHNLSQAMSIIVDIENGKPVSTVFFPGNDAVRIDGDVGKNLVEINSLVIPSGKEYWFFAVGADRWDLIDYSDIAIFKELILSPIIAWRILPNGKSCPICVGIDPSNFEGKDFISGIFRFLDESSVTINYAVFRSGYTARNRAESIEAIRKYLILNKKNRDVESANSPGFISGIPITPPGMPRQIDLEEAIAEKKASEAADVSDSTAD